MKNIFLLALILSLFFSCDTNDGVRMIEINGGHKVWTKKIGDNPDIKLLLLHGGPGATHEYFKILDQYFPQENIEYYYYDQFGSFNSDPSNNPSDWTIDRFVEEVETRAKRTGINFFQLLFTRPFLGWTFGNGICFKISTEHQRIDYFQYDGKYTGL
ncbi:MAG: hypothetical protein ACJZ1O_08495 [Candidatus Neomarinimicrobiota bacterium]